ncbi:MAG: hypothetical protein ACFWUC_07550 [Oscillospiraceae bacterium]
MDTLQNIIGMINSGIGTVIAALIAAVASIVTLIGQHKSNKTSNYLNIISTQRVEWIQKLKEVISDYCEMMDKYQWNEEKPNRESIYKATANIKLYLNFKGAPDRTILGMIDEINKIYLGEEEYKLTNQKEIVESWLNYLLFISQIYCKVEWERVKFEAKHPNTNKFKFDDRFLEYLQDVIVRAQISAYANKTGYDARLKFIQYRTLDKRTKRCKCIQYAKSKFELTKHKLLKK